MTRKGSDQTACMRRLICAFAGRTYHIVVNLMLWLILYIPLNCQLEAGYKSHLVLGEQPGVVERTEITTKLLKIRKSLGCVNMCVNY